MPIYEYKCSRCGLISEDIRTSADRDREKACPACLGHCKRAPSVFAVLGDRSPDNHPPDVPSSSDLRRCAIRADNEHLVLKDVSIEGTGEEIGVSLGAKTRLDLDGCRMDGLRTAVEIRSVDA